MATGECCVGLNLLHQSIFAAAREFSTKMFFLNYWSSALDMPPIGRGFALRYGRGCVTTLGMLFTPIWASVTKHYYEMSIPHHGVAFAYVICVTVCAATVVRIHANHLGIYTFTLHWLENAYSRPRYLLSIAIVLSVEMIGPSKQGLITRYRNSCVER